MTVLAVAIGNSDDKLSQLEWAGFWAAASTVIRSEATHVHGEFLSSSRSPYQNACWLVEGELTDRFMEKLAILAEDYRQDSIAVTVGTTVFVSPGLLDDEVARV